MDPTQSPKRSGSPLDAIDPRSPKKPETVEDSPVSQQPARTVPLEFLPDSHLPPTQELERLNALIHRGLPQSFTILVVPRVLDQLEKHCDFIKVKDSEYYDSLLEDKQATDELIQIVQDAHRRGDYGRLMLLKGFQRSRPAVPVAQPPLPSSIPSKVQDAIIGGWNAPFIGTAHIALAKNIQQMFGEALRTNPYSRKYMTHASIIQSSGSGKSRLLDRVAETIFTIPFNVRDPREASGDAWPPADDDIHYWLMTWTKQEAKMRVYARYLCFFTALFEEVRKEVEQYIPQPASASTASAWRTHLAESWSEHRNNLYSRVVKSDTVRKAWTLSHQDLDSATLRRLKTTAREALKHLLDKVCPDEACRASHTVHADEEGSSGVKNIHVLIYFDEAHVLAHPLAQSDGSLCEEKTALEVLFTVLDDFRQLGLFGVLMSTQSHIEHLEPKASEAPYSSYARRLELPPYAHVPITDTPFDCFGDRPIVASRLHADDLCDIPFMACFGRPLWRSLLLPFCDEVLAKATGSAPQDLSRTLEDWRKLHDREDESYRLLDLARVKLVSHTELDRGRRDFGQAAQVAVLDVRIMLPFEPRSREACRLKMELVASHMRTIHSIPQHRECVRSGYPSEPLLAEAAARQLHAWRTKDEDWRMLRDPGALILRDAVEGGLLDRDRGEMGEVVGRLLLVLARDRAALDVKLETQPLLFSRAVPVTAFIRALFPPAVAQAVLDSRPDNLSSGGDGSGSGSETATMTFAEAFKDAVLNFTHFARWAEDSVPDESAAVGCFVRSMAVVCRKNTSKVDVFIPVLLDRSAQLRRQVMTGILVRINSKRKHMNAASARAAFPIDEEHIGLFDSDPAPADAPMAPPRPYITLVMELGIDDLDSPSSHTDTGSAGENSVPVSVNVGHWRSPWGDRASDDDVHKAQHPRYSIAAYGCSPTVYRVMKKDDPVLYKAVLREGGPLSDHSRQDADSLYLGRMLKPTFSTEDDSWDWMENAGNEPSMDVDG